MAAEIQTHTARLAQQSVYSVTISGQVRVFAVYVSLADLKPTVQTRRASSLWPFSPCLVNAGTVSTQVLPCSGVMCACMCEYVCLCVCAHVHRLISTLASNADEVYIYT